MQKDVPTAGRRAVRTERLTPTATWLAPRPAVALPPLHPVNRRRPPGKGVRPTSPGPAGKGVSGIVLVQVALFVAAAVAYAVLSPGTYHDDDLDHYYMARAAFRMPGFFLDPWGRPAFTILYAIPAQFGLTAVRLATIVVAAGAGWFTWRAATALGFRHPAAAFGLAVAQPLFFRLSFSALAEPLAALGLAVLADSHARARPWRLALVAGLLPLARLELAVVSAAIGLHLLFRRAWRPALLVGVPVALWAAVGGLVHGDPLWLLHVVGGSDRPLATTGPLHYIRNLIAVIGPVLFLGLFLGFAVLSTPGPGARPVFAALLWLGIFGTLTALAWDRLQLGGSIGFLRHLIVLAPATALVALAGYEALTREMPAVRRAAFAAVALAVPAVVILFLSHRLEADYFIVPGSDPSRAMGLLVPLAVVLAGLVKPDLLRAPGRARIPAVVAVLAAVAFCLATVRPIALTVEQKTVKSATDFLKESPYASRPMLANHPWIYRFLERDRWDRVATPYVTRENLAAARPGSIVVWENHYGQRLYGDVPLEELRNDPRYELIFEVESGDRRFRVVVFERVAD